MQKQFQYIVDLAKKYKEYSDNPTVLLDAVNNLDTDTLEKIYTEYGNQENRFQPVNLVRAEAARMAMSGTVVTEELINRIKNRIRNRDTASFSYLPAVYLEEIKNYPQGKRDIFANWNDLWRIFHVFFYHFKWGHEKDTVQNYIEQIVRDLISRLGVPDYTCHTVDFQGSNNFGATSCWIDLYPQIKNSHRNSYQFGLWLKDSPEAGLTVGHSLDERGANKMAPVQSYEEAVEKLEALKPEILKANREIRNYFKFSPGYQTGEWETFFKEGVAAVRDIDLEVGDISKYSSQEDLNRAAGLPDDSRSNWTWNLWIFRSANTGDVIFATKGVNTCLGIGIIEGEYYYQADAGDYRHRRNVNWLTRKIYQYKPNTLKESGETAYKTLFRPDTFSPIKVWQFLLSEYVRLFPELVPVFKKHDLKYTTAKPGEVTVSAEEEAEINQPTQSFWWLNANPKTWSLSAYKEGDVLAYTTFNERGNKRRIYKHFEAVKPGDLMIGYESTPVKQVKALLEVTRAIHKDDNGEEKIEFTVSQKFEIPVRWNDLKNNPRLSECEVFINNQGSLFHLTEEEFDIIQETIDLKNISMGISDIEKKRYNLGEDPDKPFLPSDEFKRIIELLKRKKNIILQGPPGVGKTFLARKIAYQMMGEVNDAQIEMVQFHQSYSYEDFVQGLRPSKSGGFDLREGVFYSFCQRAAAHPDRQFFFIIDEINRGNLSKIFGELLMLIEPDKRSEKFALNLTYSEEAEDRFFIPEELYIIGTMNTADRSLALVDYALRRRFAFFPLRPDFSAVFRDHLARQGLSAALTDHIASSVLKANGKIRDDINLGDGFQIGHSYFCTYKESLNEDEWYNQVLDYEIKPLLEEIWFDDLEKVSDVMKILQR